MTHLNDLALKNQCKEITKGWQRKRSYLIATALDFKYHLSLIVNEKFLYQICIQNTSRN